MAKDCKGDIFRAGCGNAWSNVNAACRSQRLSMYPATLFRARLQAIIIALENVSYSRNSFHYEFRFFNLCRYVNCLFIFLCLICNFHFGNWKVLLFSFTYFLYVFWICKNLIFHNVPPNSNI